MKALFERLSNAFSPEIKKISSIVLILLFLFQILIVLSPWDNIPGIELWDETYSLEKGVNWTYDMFLSYEESPLYSFFYYILSLIVEDTITIYYLNHILLLVGLILVWFFVLYRISGSLFWATFSSYALIFFGFYKVWPRVNFLTSIIILLSMLIVFRIRNELAKVNTALIFSYILIFIRPEFYISFYLIFIYSLYIVTKELIRIRVEKKTQFKNFLFINRTGLILLLLVVLLFTFFVTPVPDDSQRSFMAFGQHYSFNIHKAEGIASDPWFDWERVIRRDFGDSTSVISAVLKNPGAFLSHILQNVDKFIRRAYSMGLKGGWYTIMLFVFPVMFFIRYIYYRGSGNGEEIDCRIKNRDILILFFFMAPVIISLLFIFPRSHYILVLWTLVIILLTKLSFIFDFEKYILLDHCCTYILLLVLFFSFPGIDPDSGDRKLETIRSIRELERTRELGAVLELGGRWDVYLKTVKRTYSPIPGADESWYKRNIDTIIVTGRLIKNINGQLLLNIIETPEIYGFRKIKIKNGISLLLNKKND